MIPIRFTGKVALAGVVVGALLSLPQASVASPRANGASMMMEDENSAAAAVTAKLD